ncbi:MAG: DUF1178 family protein [Proteobacteria bacterium]|nr:DUF1178 family protein [Pseudomonadota bacterium]MBS0574366.1 DUF1178 family protein [Pseudomonadota bacterium]
MIHYALTCDKDHAFDSWFQSSEAFDRLLAAGHIGCAVCGSVQVGKRLMAPTVRPARESEGGAAGKPIAPPPGVLSAPRNPVERAFAALRRQIEENSDYVGANFAAEARAIHDGDKPVRTIHGEARPEEARSLIEDGIAVMPLPFLPARKVN